MTVFPDPDFVKRIAAEEGIKQENVLFGVCHKIIQWDNCEGGVATMARPGEAVYLTRKTGALSLHADYGDHIISDYGDVDESVNVVTKEEAIEAHSKFEREQTERIARRRLELEQYEADRSYYDDDLDY